MRLGAESGLAPFAVFSAAYFAHIGFTNPFLPLWLKDLGLGLLTISLLSSVQSATRLFAPYAWGALSDRSGERIKLLRLGAVLALLASFGLWFDGGPWWLATVFLLTFTNTSAMMSMGEAAMAQLVSRGGAFDVRRYGRVRMWGSLGFLLTVLLAGAGFDAFGMRIFPVMVSVTLLLVGASAWMLPDTKEAVHPSQLRPAVGPVLRQPAVRWFFAALFFHVLAHMGIYIFFSLYLDSVGYAKSVIGLLWAVSVLAEVVWFARQGRWMRGLSLNAWLVLCGCATLLRMGITAGAASVLALVVAAQLLHALSFAAHHAACIGLVSQHFPGRLRGRGQALFTVIGYGLPGVLGGLLGGLLSARFGLQSIFWACSATSVLATGCALKAWYHRPPLAGAAA